MEYCYAAVIVLGLRTIENKEDGEGIKAMPDEVVLQESLEARLFNFIEKVEKVITMWSEGCGRNDASLVPGRGSKRYGSFCFHPLGALTHHVNNFKYLAGTEGEGAHGERQALENERCQRQTKRQTNRQRERKTQPVPSSSDSPN